MKMVHLVVVEDLVVEEVVAHMEVVVMTQVEATPRTTKRPRKATWAWGDTTRTILDRLKSPLIKMVLEDHLHLSMARRLPREALSRIMEISKVRLNTPTEKTEL